VPLKLDLKTGVRLVINGAVIENIGPNTKLLVHNESSILREKEILSADDSATPASRAYFALQCAYMFPHEKEKYLEIFKQLLDDYSKALPSSAEIGKSISESLEEGKLYKALKGAQELVRHEASIVEGMRQTTEDATGEYLPEAGDDIGNRIDN
jgi:flagellar biosynthesis repressor protein FlbT